jgi:thiosulfate/3-mercaptopyruvate sulfurtransferase
LRLWESICVEALQPGIPAIEGSSGSRLDEMTAKFPYPIVETEWLAAIDPGEGRIKIVDGSARLPGAEESAVSAYHQRHIPGAVFFDIDEIADKSSPLPHMLPSADVFAAAVGALGVSADDGVVVYDDTGLFSAARVWWTFRAMGHRDVAVLNGGLPKWIAEKRPTTADLPTIETARYKTAPPLVAACDADGVRQALAMGDVVLDARPEARFCGQAAEPRVGLRSGHMPGARSLPHSRLLQQNGALQTTLALEAAFDEIGASPDRAVIASCGSGVTAAVLCLALESLGRRNHALYDGSWAEWGLASNDPALFPVAID